MFRRAPRSFGHTMSEPLGLWEFASETEATEKIQRTRDEKPENSPPDGERPMINFGRHVSWGQK